MDVITNKLAKDKEISERWRGFADIADARHVDSRVEADIRQSELRETAYGYAPWSVLFFRRLISIRANGDLVENALRVAQGSANTAALPG
jgi:hypothetical protein